ncbi:sugar dehydrogenase complex small subunit [Pantoea sp. MBD-2R]|uniref:sugar dehydrogenase complex small subunit n=1 Tax=Pantoea sp. MBD-2R TaxID=3141540 RepID=UPI0031830B85
MSLTRRRLLAGSAGLFAASIAARWLPVFAYAPPAEAISVPAHFMTLSQMLTGMAQPDPLLARRLYSWLHQQFDDPDGDIQRLSALLTSQPDLQGNALLTVIAQQSSALRDLYQALISGWYLGVVNVAQPECLAFENIVSYRLVKTSLLPPSYAPGEPDFWIHPPHQENSHA